MGKDYNRWGLQTAQVGIHPAVFAVHKILFATNGNLLLLHTDVWSQACPELVEREGETDAKDILCKSWNARDG